MDYLNVLAFAVQIVIETINNSKSKNDVNSRLSLLKQNGKFYHFWHYFSLSTWKYVGCPKQKDREHEKEKEKFVRN